MTHQFFKKATKTKKSSYPRFYIEAPDGQTRAERRAEWSRRGRMNTRGQFSGGVASSGVYGSLLFDRYYSGRNMSKFPHWYGWSTKPRANEYRAAAVAKRRGSR